MPKQKLPYFRHVMRRQGPWEETDAGLREGSGERGDQTGDGWYPQKKPQAESPGAEQGREDRTRGTSLVHGVTRSRSRLITV